jgi:hypothetical protein
MCKRCCHPDPERRLDEGRALPDWKDLGVKPCPGTSGTSEGSTLTNKVFATNGPVRVGPRLSPCPQLA